MGIYVPSEKLTEIVVTQLSELDKFVVDVSKILDQFTDYVIVSGYIPILFGRSRGTEDVDFVIGPIDKETFRKMCRTALETGFEFINPEDCNGLYEMLQMKMAIRMAYLEFPMQK